MERQSKLSMASFKLNYFPYLNLFGGILRPDEILLLVEDGCILTQKDKIHLISEEKKNGDCSPYWVYFQKLSNKVFGYVRSFGHCDGYMEG